MDNDYKSPLKKLVVFFEKSRDQWKEKTLATKAQLKSAKNRIKFLESSKSELKDKVKTLKEEKKQLESQLNAAASPQVNDDIKKKRGTIRS
jgi:chromosome segregation ATPase